MMDIETAMNKVLKLTQLDDMKVFFTSDFHLNHSPKWPIPIWKSRGFDSVGEMNDSIIKSVNDAVRSNDVLFFLGDFCLNTNEFQFEEFLSRIQCQNVYCLWGNHNSQLWNRYEKELLKLFELCKIENPNEHIPTEIYPVRYRNLVFLGNCVEVMVDGKYFILNHYAQSTWNYMSKGSCMCHGHSHGNLKTSLPNALNYGKILDVSWDVFKKPISSNEILSIINKKQIIIVDHHQN